MYRHGDDDEELDDADYPDPWDEDGDDSDDTIPCPHCREPVYDDAERCPSCGKYLSHLDAPARFPWWFALGFLLSMAVALHWAFWFWF